MSITRRGLLQGILAAGIAPAIVKAEILMPVRKIIVPPPLYRGEIGSWNDVVFQKSMDDPFGMRGYLVPKSRIAAIKKEIMRLAIPVEGPLIISPSAYEELRKGYA